MVMGGPGSCGRGLSGQAAGWAGSGQAVNDGRICGPCLG